MNASDREKFDQLVEAAIDALPAEWRRAIDEIPVVVLDRPTKAMLRSLGVPPDQWEQEVAALCGLHTGTMLTERSIEHSGDLPTDIHLFREGIVEAAGGWDHGLDRIAQEIRVTLLHEIGHHFGLDEDDLEKLGYG